MENRRVYLDNASTTYVGNEALREMMPVFSNVYGNPSSLHSFGREAVDLLDQARDRVAKAIGAKPSEIYFTSGGTEANNLAIRGLAYANRYKGNHIITSCIEHSSVLEACKQLEKEKGDAEKENLPLLSQDWEKKGKRKQRRKKRDGTLGMHIQPCMLYTRRRGRSGRYQPLGRQYSDIVERRHLLGKRKRNGHVRLRQ